MLWRYGEALGEPIGPIACITSGATWTRWRRACRSRWWRPKTSASPTMASTCRPSRGPRPQCQGGRLRGASTISQQVAKNLFLWQGRSWIRKAGGLVHRADRSAVAKGAHPEMYANIAEFGDGVYGAQAAAQKFWGKDAARLSRPIARGWRRCCRRRGANAAKPGPQRRRGLDPAPGTAARVGPRTFRKSERALPDLRAAATYNPGMTRERLTFVIAAWQGWHCRCCIRGCARCSTRCPNSTATSSMWTTAATTTPGR